MTDLEKFITKCEENAVPDEKINTSDVPEMTEKDFARGHFKYWKPIKKSVTLRLDVDVLESFKSLGKGYQTKINEVLRDYAFGH